MTASISSDESAVHVVPRTNLPSTPPPAMGMADEKPFRGHEVFRRLLPDTSAVSMSWIHAQVGDSVVIRSKPMPTLLLVLGGAARLIGHSTRTVAEGDVITVPVGQEYGFDEVARKGLEVLEVGFGATRVASGTASTLDELLARNETLAARAREQAFFRLLQDGTLDNPKKRARFLDCLQVFSNAFQAILVARQATCREERFVEVFSRHWRDELGHNDMLAQGRATREVNDPVLNATVTWFCRQMFVLDNAEKAVLVHLVLETAGHHFHTIAKDVFRRDASSGYFQTHSEDDEDHSAVATGLLTGQSAATYRRLCGILESSWEMFEAMGNRIAKLTATEGAS